MIALSDPTQVVRQFLAQLRSGQTADLTATVAPNLIPWIEHKIQGGELLFLATSFSIVDEQREVSKGRTTVNLTLTPDTQQPDASLPIAYAVVVTFVADLEAWLISSINVLVGQGGRGGSNL